MGDMFSRLWLFWMSHAVWRRARSWWAMGRASEQGGLCSGAGGRRWAFVSAGERWDGEGVWGSGGERARSWRRWVATS